MADITADQSIGTTRRGTKGGPSLPLLKMGNLLWGGLDLTELEVIDRDVAFADGASLERGDILFNTRNTPELVGKTAYWPGDIAAAHDNNLMRIRLVEAADSRFVAAWMGSPAGRSSIRQFVCASTSVGAVYWRDLGNLAVPFPPLKEQRQIAAMLSTWDEAISTADRLVTARTRQYAALSRALLAPTFLPVPLRNWDHARLGDLFNERDERGGSGRLLSITAHQGVISRDDVGRKDTSAEDKSSYKKIKPGDIGYNTMRMWQGVSALSALEGLISPAYTVAIPHGRISGSYAAHLFKQPQMIDRFWRHSQGLVDDTLNLKFPHFAEIGINIPPLHLQQQIAVSLNEMNSLVGRQRERADLLRRQKRGMMQKLFTGEWRLITHGHALDPCGQTAERLVEAAE